MDTLTTVSPAASGRGARRSDLRRTLQLVALYTVPVVAALGPVIDPDLWWHLRTGRWMVEHHWVPMVDPFSAYGMGKPWVAYSWLYELLVYGLFRTFGLTGVVIYTASLMIAITLALHVLVYRYRLPFIEEVVLLVLAVCGLGTLVTPRPWLFSILFFIIELDVILAVRRSGRARRLWLLPPLFVLWANIHIQFIYGLFILGLAAVEPLLERLGRAAKDEDASIRLWMIVLVMSVAATLLTPYHVLQYQTVIDTLRQTSNFAYVDELKAMSFRRPADWAILVLSMGAMFSLGRFRQSRPFLILLLLTGVLLSFRAGRDVWVVDIAAVAMIATVREKYAGERFALTLKHAAVAACLLVVVTFFVAVNRHINPIDLSAEVSKAFPVVASEIVEERGYSGPLYNHFNWGGYFIWRLPQFPVSMDGRTVLHGDARIEQAVKTYGGASGWQSDPDLDAARLVILQAELPLTSLLRLDQRFNLVYEDKIAVVFVRR